MIEPVPPTGSEQEARSLNHDYQGSPILTSFKKLLFFFFTLPTKVSLVKAMVFSVVMYGCESWTLKKAECRRIDAFEL